MTVSASYGKKSFATGASLSEKQRQSERERERERQRTRRVEVSAAKERERQGLRRTNGRGREEKGLKRRREQMEKEERDKGEEERTNGRRREGQGKRKGEEKRVAATTSDRVYLGSITRVYQHCQALRFPSEPFNCCHNGKRSACHQFGDYPSPLKDLFTGSNTAESSNFQDNIRQYNSAFSFASFKLICPLG